MKAKPMLTYCGAVVAVYMLVLIAFAQPGDGPWTVKGYEIVGANYSIVSGVFGSDAISLEGGTFLDCGETDPELEEMTASI